MSVNKIPLLVTWISYIRVLQFSIFIFATSIVSCDPVYPVSVLNARKDSVRIVAEVTGDFNTDMKLTAYKRLKGSYGKETITFMMAPGSQIDCGTAIAELDDDLPFTVIKIYGIKDSIIATNKLQVIDLFEKNFWGNPKAPYRLMIQ